MIAVQAFGGNNTSGAIDIAAGLNAKSTQRQDFETETFVVGTLCNNGKAAGSATNQDADAGLLIPVSIQAGALRRNTHSGPDGVGVQEHIAYTLEARAEVQAIAFDCKASGQNGFGIGEIASTMRSMGHAGSHQNGGVHQAVMTSMAVRRLTPRECERLQGLPDGYTRIPLREYRVRRITKNRPIDRWEKTESGWMLMSADGPRYKALGNSMAVTVMRWIGERIQLVSNLRGATLEAA